MKLLRQMFGGGVRQFGMIFALLALILIFQISTGGKLLTPTNAQNIINGNSYVLILAVGMVLVIIAGHIDLSVGSVAAVVGIIVALTIRDWGVPWWAGVLIGLAAGALIGAWQGFWVAYVGVPGFIATLAGMMIFRGANQFIGKSDTVPIPEQIQVLGAGYLPGWGPNTGLNNSTLLLGLIAIGWLAWRELQSRRTALEDQEPVRPAAASIARIAVLAVVVGYVTVLFGSGRPGTSFPVAGLILVVLVIVYEFAASRTIFGRHVYAVGGNRNAAQLSGVDIRKTNFLVLMNMSVLAALAGIVFIGRSTSSGPFDGTNWELDAIAAVFIGGAAVSGGTGTVVGSMVGGLVMAVLNNGLQLMGVGSDLTQIIKGMVLLIAVAFDVYSKATGRPSITGMLMGRKQDGWIQRALERRREAEVAEAM